MDNLTQTKCQVIFNFYFDSNPFFSSSDTFYSTLLYFGLLYSRNTNVLTEKCSLVWQPTSIILPVCGNHTWAKKRSASGFTCLYYARGETDLTSEPRRQASEIKSAGNDLTEMLLVTRQKLVFSVGAVSLMWFQKQSGDESRLESSLKYDFHDLSIKFPLLLKSECIHALMPLFHVVYILPFMLLFFP